eukprot:10317123-Lingulodinium_polyedra.AAC.1
MHGEERRRQGGCLRQLFGWLVQGEEALGSEEDLVSACELVRAALRLPHRPQLSRHGRGDAVPRRGLRRHHGLRRHAAAGLGLLA